MPPYGMREFFAPFYPKDAKHRFIAMAMIRAYFDDSGTHARSPIVIAAGILISDEQHDLMKETWDAILERNHNLPFFHTTKLKAGKEPPYSAMSESEKELLLDQLVRLMSVRVRMSCACAIPRPVYDAVLTDEEKKRYGSPYALAAQTFWTGIRLWAERNHFTDPIPFVAEAGNEDEEHLSVVFEKAMADPVLKKLFHLHSLTIGAKTEFVGLQAADIVANSTHDLTSYYIAGGRPPSKWMRIVSLHMKKITHHQIIMTEKILREEMDQLNEYHHEAIAAQKKAASL